MSKYFKKISNIGHISECKSNGLSDQVIKPPNSSDSSLTLALNYTGNKIRVKFDGGYPWVPNNLPSPPLSDC